MSPSHKRTTTTTILFASLSVPMQHMILPSDYEPRYDAPTSYAIYYSNEIPTGQCYASPDFFLIRTCLVICCQKDFLNLSQNFPEVLVGNTRSSCNISYWTSCEFFFFVLQEFFWLSKFTYHISASVQWYQICWITGLGYCIIYFALIEVLVWRPGFPSCIGTCLFLSSLSLPLECKVSSDSASYIYDMFK